MVITAGHIVFTQFDLFLIEANSARYMLSALVQRQAAIVAIDITLKSEDQKASQTNCCPIQKGL